MKLLRQFANFLIIISLLVTFYIPIDVSCEEKENTIEMPYDVVASDESSTSSSSTPRSVIGNDDRSLVTNVSASPYKKIVFLRSTFPDGTVVRGTGAILGYDLVLTAAHVLYRETYGGQATSVRVYFEVDGIRPPETADATSFYIYVPPEYINGETENDWGFFRTSSNIGSQKGWFGFSYSTTFDDPLSITGYPDTAPNGSYSYHMYTHSGYVTVSSSNSIVLTYTIDTSAGQSGAPIYDSDQFVWGVHYAGTNNGSYNKGRRIDGPMFEKLRQAKQEGALLWGS
ncbi:MAG: trypsin-like serine peptidase [Eubacteriales bacterium]